MLNMRVAHIVWSMTTGGIETMLVNIINEQVKTEEVELFIVNDMYYPPLVEKISPQCRIVRCGRRKGSRNPLPILKLNWCLWKYAPDVVHVHAAKLSDIIWDRRKMVRTIHSVHEACREYPRMKALFSISKTVWQITLEQGFESEVIENGIPVEKFRQKHKYPVKEVFHFVQVGRLNSSKQKGQDILIAAVNELVNRRDVRNLQVHFVGEGETRTMLEAMVEDFHLEEYVRFEGLKTQDEIFEHLADYDCFVQPSRFEGFGLTVAEAMAARLPVLVSDIEGPLEVIDNGRLGMTFKCENVIDLADKMEAVLRGEYDYSCIEKAWQRVKEKYDISVTARKYVEEYRKISG